jgi:hypothetical protein
MQWTLYIKSTFNATGQWYEQYANLKAGSTPIVNGVPQWDEFTPVNDEHSPTPSTQPSSTKTPDSSPRKILFSNSKKKQEQDELSPKNPKFMLFQSRVLAQFLLSDIWVRFDGMFECRATWEADGEVNQVRLKRALVGFGDDGYGEE